jgi:hypothetical protein
MLRQLPNIRHLPKPVIFICGMMLMGVEKRARTLTYFWSDAKRPPGVYS